MAPAEPIAFVHLEGDAGGRVGEGGEQRVGLRGMTGQGAEPMRRAVGRHPGEARVFRQGAACHDCANGIEQDEL